MKTTTHKLARILPVAAATLLLLCGGCATLTCSSPGSLANITIKDANGQPAQMVLLQTSGFYMFWSLPIASGDLRWNEQTQNIEGGMTFFEDHVSIQELQTALLKFAESRNCDLADVNFHDTDTSYAGVSYEGALGLLFGSSDMSVSAVLVPRTTAANNQ